MRAAAMALSPVGGAFPAGRAMRSNEQGEISYADYQSARARRTEEDRQQDQEPGPSGQPAEAWRLRPRLHADTEEAQLRAAQGGACPAHERHRGHDVYSRRR